jgi:hypothetical protein
VAGAIDFIPKVMYLVQVLLNFRYLILRLI